MVHLNRFNLIQLKEIYNDLKNYGYFNNTKTYQLCKFDIIVLLRNTKLFDENETDYLLFYNPSLKKWLKLSPRRKIYDRGEKVSKIVIRKKSIIMEFD